MSFNHAEFRQALSQFATGVAVITARGQDGEDIGLTINSFSSVSLDPPLILFSIDRRALSLPALEAAEGYAVNVLSRDQEQLSNQFARPLANKWDGIKHTLGDAKIPLLHGVLAHFECLPYAQHDGGDHVIFVGRVTRFVAPNDAAPLLFFRGRYHGLHTKAECLPG